MPEHAYLADVLVLLVALLLFVPLFQRLNVGSVLGYLAAGVVIGPSALGLVGNIEGVRALGEFGVVFLLFAVGLEIKFERLRLFGPRTYGLAIAQVLVTGAVFTAVAHAWGLDTQPALIVGAGLALSSTAIVLQMLGERTQMTGPLGRTAIAMLLIQDVTVGPLLVFVSVAADAPGNLFGALGIAAVKSLIVLVVIFLAERIVLRPLLRLAAGAGAPEVFTGATLLLVLGTGWATQFAGLSMALGAFLAGLMVADTEFRHQVAADIQPFRGLLLGLFFITVGMTIDVGFAVGKVAAVSMLVVGLIGAKAALIAGLALVFGVPLGRALGLGGLLSQGSEFAFVLFALATGHGLFGGELAQLLIVSVALSMAVTPIGLAIVRRVVTTPGAPAARSALGNLDRESGDAHGHVVVAGFGQVGMAVARHLASQHVPVLIIDLNPRRVTASRARGLPVFYGNATNLQVLRAARLDRAVAFVVALPDADAAEQVTAVARNAYPDVRIFARVPDEDGIRRLRRAGADAVAPEGLTTALELAERVMLVYEPDET